MVDEVVSLVDETLVEGVEDTFEDGAAFGGFPFRF